MAACGALAGGSLAMLVGAAPAASLSLPSVTVSVPVTTPTVTVQAPPPPVKTPTISAPLKAPPPIEVPTVAVKAPTVTAPKVTVKAPVFTVTATTTVSTSPTVSAKAPPAGVPAPSASVNAPGGSTAGSLVTVKAPSTSATSSSNGSASSSRSKTRSGSTGAARAHKRSLKAIVAQLRGCLGNLPERQRRLLELRTGLGSKPLGPQAVAARLHVGFRRFAELEKRAVRELRASASKHGCDQNAGKVVGGVMSFIASAFGAGPGEMHGGLQPVSYNLDARSLRVFLQHAHSPHDGPLDAAISPAATDALLALLLVLVVGVVVAIVVVGASGRGPRDPEWRRRAATRFRVFH
jgi:hypothetical protein